MPYHRPSIVTLACVLALSGCGQSSDEQAMEDGAGETAGVDVSDDRVEITTEAGRISVASGEGVPVPAGFPNDIYVYENAKVVASMTMPQGQMLTLETVDPAARVAESYEAAMSAAGWEREMAMDSAAGRMYAYAKENLHVQVTIAGGDDGANTTITLVAGSGE